MKIARVFPSKTSHTPTDKLCFFDHPGLFDFNKGIEEVHVSVVFKWDLDKAEKLAISWGAVGAVKIGGPATGQRAKNFIPGMYLKKGITITSRGCPNKCWFCSVWKRDGNIRELKTIHPGNIIQDDNFLATSKNHQEKVFQMLQKQNGIQFTGGLDPKFLNEWNAEKLGSLKINQLFFAYDTPDDLKYLKKSSIIIKKIFPSRQKLRCYALCGYPDDSIEHAKNRMLEIAELGFFPMAMRWRDENGNYDNNSIEWKNFARTWIRPAAIYTELKKYNL